jgi:indole-3-glycerol phosphate synthase
LSFLAQMATDSAARVQAARAARGEEALLSACRAAEAPPALSLQHFDLIAEYKRHSPAEGALAMGADVAARALEYGRAGAAAVSVLTEPRRFGGDLDDLRAAAAALLPCGIPAMRKDFLVDPWQILEARAAGAGGVLLILAMLGDTALGELLAAAREQKLFVLLEAFDEGDLERALLHSASRTEESPILVGVNTRDLRTLVVEPGRLARLAPLLPAGIPGVAESGLRNAADAAAAAALGYRLALVGTALRTAAEPARLTRDMLAAGRAAVTAEARRSCS